MSNRAISNFPDDFNLLASKIFVHKKNQLKRFANTHNVKDSSLCEE